MLCASVPASQVALKWIPSIWEHPSYSSCGSFTLLGRFSQPQETYSHINTAFDNILFWPVWPDVRFELCLFVALKCTVGELVELDLLSMGGES